MEDDNSLNTAPIFSGRPFLSTSKIKIDVLDGSLTMKFHGEIVHFNISEAMRYPSDVHSISHVDIIDPLL